jgi:hypothetical protein
MININSGEQLTTIGTFDLQPNQELILNLNQLEYNFNLECYNSNNDLLLKWEINKKKNRLSLPFKIDQEYTLKIRTIEDEPKEISYELVEVVNEE